MECKWHSGTEADLVCLKCGQPYCRECVKETREAHYCPDCHRASVDRLAAQMGGRKEVKPPKVKEPKPPKEPRPPKEKPAKDDKKLRKPAEREMGPRLDDLGAPPPPPIERPEPSLTPEERAAFWGDGGKDEAVAPFTRVESAAPQPQPPAAPPRAPSKPTGPVQVKGMPPPLDAQATPAEPAPLGPPPGARVVKKRPLPSKEDREAAVMAAEGFPSQERARRGERQSGKAAAVAAVPVGAAVDGVAEGADVIVPKGRFERMRDKRRDRKAMNLPVAMQIPDDYDGEVTSEATYLKAVLFGLGAGLILGAAFAALAWLVHKDLGIFGWVIGFAVGLAVAYGSGWHFNWKLGLIAAGITMFCVSIQRIGYFMLDVRFNKILPIKLGIWPLFRESFTTYYQSFWSLWLLFFLLSALVAFLVAFRPPPIRLQLADDRGSPRGRVARGKA